MNIRIWVAILCFFGTSGCNPTSKPFWVDDSETGWQMQHAKPLVGDDKISQSIIDYYDIVIEPRGTITSYCGSNDLRIKKLPNNTHKVRLVGGSDSFGRYLESTDKLDGGASFHAPLSESELMYFGYYCDIK